MLRLLCAIFLSWLLFEMPAGVGQAQEPDPVRARVSAATPLDLVADEVSYDEERDVFEAIGSVRVDQPGGRSLTADWLVFNATTRIGVAVGNVVIRDGDDLVQANTATVNLDTLVSMATDASLDVARPGFAVEGDTIQRTGVNTYRVKKGIFTTCRCTAPGDDRPWQIEAERTDVRVGGYAVARNVKFRALGVPLFYVPWFLFPVKTERQTGFLAPGFSEGSRNGTEIEIPFFWALKDNTNLLLRPTYLSKRGFKNALDFEYVFGEEGSGHGTFAALPGDDQVDRLDPDTPFSDNRWAYRLRHDQPLGDGIRFGADVNAASDNQYVVDFEDFPGELRSSRFLESSAWASYGRGAVYAGAEVSYKDDLQSPNNLDRDDFLLQRLPDVRLSLLQRPLAGLPLRGGLDLRYTYFHQDADKTALRGNTPIRGLFFDTGPDGLFDRDEPNAAGIATVNDEHSDNLLGGELDGVFQEGELLADDGHRLDLYPRVTLPLRFGAIETLSEVGFRETFYSPERASSERRELWSGRLDTRARFGRALSLGGRDVFHLVEPGATFVALSAPGQDSNPLFIPGSGVGLRRLIDADPRFLVRDPGDRVPDARFLQFGVRNRFFGLSSEDPVSGDRSRPGLIATARLSAGYDFLDGQMTDVFLRASLYAWKNLSLGVDFGYDPKQTRLDEAGASVSWKGLQNHALTPSATPRHNEFSFSYRFIRDPGLPFEKFQRSEDLFEEFDSGLDRVNQFSLSGLLVATRRVDLLANGYLSIAETSTNAGNLSMVLHSTCGCWKLTGLYEHRIRPAQDRISIQIQLAGFGFME